MQQFAEADFFLFLRTEEWRPRGALYLEQVPSYLQKAVNRDFAELLLRPLLLESIEQLRERAAERDARFRSWFQLGIILPQLHAFDFGSIGSR